MSAPAHSLLGVAGGPWVSREGEDIDLLYPVGALTCELGVAAPSCAVIFVAQLEGKNLVCIPGACWHRTIAKRILPTKAFLKPVSVEVVGCDVEDRSEVSDDDFIKVWLGFLADDMAENVVEFDRSEPLDYDFPEGRLPYGAALVDLARDHFAFFSPAEEPPKVPEGGGLDGGGVPDLSSRVGNLEELLMDIQAKLKDMVAPSFSETKVPRPSALKSHAKTKPKAKTIPSSPPTFADPVFLYPDLDPGVVKAAIQAGVAKENLEQMQKLVSSNVRGAKALRQQTKVAFADPLSEEEEEGQKSGEEKGGVGSAEASSEPLTLALTKLTDIVDHLAESKKRSKSRLEAALDGVATSSTDASFASSGKRSAAARRALRMTLQEAPEEIYGMIERLMAEDVTSQSAVPGSSGPVFSARSWMEHRSRIGSFRATAHCGWGVAGILDALMAGKVPLARAKTALLLLQIDQSCIDKGSWVLSGELSLEMPPPMAALATHNLPSVGEGEWPYSRLLDSRWSEIAVSHLKDQDDYLNRRKNLGRIRTTTQEEEEDGGGAAGRRAKAKAKQKALGETTN